MSRENVGRPPGTTLQVEGLFYNVPARRKFLRTDYTEQRHVDAWLTRYAMAYPNLRFTLSHSDNVVFQAPGSGQLRDVLVAVHGVEIGEQMLDVQTVEGRENSRENSIRVRGLVSPPSLHRANRTYITFFVNGRWVQDRSLTYAIIQAYHTLLPKGRYPLGVVMVSLPPSEVDVNVHPAKSEVRFRDGDAVFRAVQKAVRRTLIQQSPVPVSRPPATAWAGGQGGQWDANRRERFASLESGGAGRRPREAEATSSGLGGMTSAGGEDLPPLRLLGQLRTTYVVAEGPNGLILVDQHAAHERVLFDRLMASRQTGEVTSQALLEPSLVDLPPEAAAIIEQHLESIVALGFQLEPFGSGSFLLRAVPAEVADTMGDPASLLDEVATACLAGDTPLADRVEERVAREVCKQAAIKAGQVMSRDEMAELLRALERSRSPRTCPHGRPTMIQISVSHLANEFGR
jgi:DNA mismatch repair protein MutL